MSVWLARQRRNDADDPYEGREEFGYYCPLELENASQIAPGDAVITHRPIRLNEDAARLCGVGSVHHIERIGNHIHATYDRWSQAEAPEEFAIRVENTLLRDGPAIYKAGSQQLDHALRACGAPSLFELGLVDEGDVGDLLEALNEYPRPWAYAVRAGSGARWFEEFRLLETISIGFNPVGDLTGLTKSEITDEVKEAFPGAPQRKLQTVAWQLRFFAYRMHVGDVVITPAPDGETVLLGRISGGYEFRSEPTIDKWQHYRPVTWIGEVQRSSLPAKTLRSLKTPATLWYVDGQSELVDLAYGEGAPAVRVGEGSKGPVPLSPLAELARRLHLDVSFLETIEKLIKDRRQVIFYGPPGTGKTFVARELARTLADPDRVTLVQFHPSYAYEDFVEGYRPDPGAGGFRLVEGPLKRLSERAESDPDRDFYLIIDEINRGNVAKVFGELYFLLEYRDEQITLQYSEEPFSLPDNLYVIGTMNSADRSIALIDAALRRRFHFVPFFPQDGAIGQVLRDWLKDNKAELEWVADVVDRANEHLERHGAIGPSHFLRADLDEDAVKLIWEHSIIPYIEEMFFGQDERIAEFALDRLRRGPRYEEGLEG